MIGRSVAVRLSTRPSPGRSWTRRSIHCTCEGLVPLRACALLPARPATVPRASGVEGWAITSLSVRLRPRVIMPASLRGSLPDAQRPPTTLLPACPRGFASVSTGMGALRKTAPSAMSVGSAAPLATAAAPVRHPVLRPPRALPSAVVTPVNVALLAELLARCPHVRARAMVLHGFRSGFDIGFRGLGFPTRPRNLRSARAIPDAVSAAVALELQRGHIAGPFRSPLPCVHCSPLGAAPKPSGAARLILDLSSPRGRAVNEGIDPDLYSVQYSSFDDAVRLVVSVGPRAALAKLDIRHAFRICPV